MPADQPRTRTVGCKTGTYGFSYDNMGRLIGTSTGYSFLASRTFTTAYAYDAASNRTGFTDPESGATSYIYDTVNRLETLTPPSAFGTGNFGFTYDVLSGGSIPVGGRLAPDLIDPFTLAEFGFGEVYEIKSVYSEVAAIAKVALDVVILNRYGRSYGLKWIPGATYLAPPFLDINPSTFAVVTQPFPGVITYCVINETELLSIVAGALALSLYLGFSSVALTAAYGY